MSDFLAELIGTAILIVFGDGVVGGVLLKRSKAENGGWLLISLAWGLGVTLAIYGVGTFSGAHINPAVTLAMAITGDLLWAEVPTYMSGQVCGGLLGGALIWLHYLPHWRYTEDPSLKLAVFATGPAVRSYPSNLVSEIIGTFVLVNGLLFIGANEFSQGLNPLVVGLLVVAIGMSLGGTTGYAINPARDLGPRLAHWILPVHGKGRSDWSYGWIPVLGPLLGGGLGALAYLWMVQGQLKPAFWIFLAAVTAVMIWSLITELKKTS